MTKKSHRGQVMVEYFLLFAVVVLVTLISLTTLDNDVATTLENLFTDTASKMPMDDGGPSLSGVDPGPVPDPGPDPGPDPDPMAP